MTANTTRKQPNRYLLVQSQKWKHAVNKNEICAVNNKDTGRK